MTFILFSDDITAGLLSVFTLKLKKPSPSTPFGVFISPFEIPLTLISESLFNALTFIIEPV